nr:uncharacterized protein LOC113693273 [Coffea arabica]
MTIPTHRKHPLITKDYDAWWSTRSNSVSSTPLKFTAKIPQQSSKKDTVTFANELVHSNGVIEIVTDITSSTLRKNKTVSSPLKNIVARNKSSKNSRQAIKEAQPVIPAKKMPPKVSKSLSVTHTEEDVEIETMDGRDSIEAIEEEGTQTQGIESTKEEPIRWRVAVVAKTVMGTDRRRGYLLIWRKFPFHHCRLECRHLSPHFLNSAKKMLVPTHQLNLKLML